MDQHTFYLSLKFVCPAALDNGAENLSRYADSRSAYQEVPTFGGLSTAITLLTKCSPPDCSLSQVHWMHTVRSTFTLFCYLCSGLPNGLLPLRFLKDVELQDYWCQIGNKLTDTFKPVQENSDSQCQHLVQRVTTVFNVNNIQGDWRRFHKNQNTPVISAWQVWWRM